MVPDKEILDGFRPSMLTIRTPGLRGLRLLWTWCVWGSGFALTASTLAESVPAMVASTALLFALFCPWLWFVGRKLG